MRHNTIKPVTLDHSFWALAEVINALRNRDVGCLLRLVALHARASQTRIGTATGLSQGQVSQIMNGTRQINSIDVLERVADGLAMPDEARMALGLAPQYREQTEKSNPFGTYPATIKDAITSLERLSAIDGSGRAEALSLTFRETGFIIASRDWIVARMATDRPPLLPKRVTSADATAVRDIFAAFQELDTKYGGAHAHAALVQYLRCQAIPLLGIGCTDTVHRELFHAVAEQVYLAGLTAFDIGACGLAQQYFVYALRLAQEGEDDAFAANILAAMAHLANHHGQGAEGVQLAQAGLNATARVANKVVAMRLSIALARAYALQGDSRACVRAVTAAEQALDKAGQASEQRWTRFLDSAYLLGEIAQCFVDLEQAQLAERFVHQAIEVNTGRHRRLVLSHAILATARGRMGERDGAADALTNTLNLMSRLQSSRTLRAVSDAITAVRLPTGVADPVIARAAAIVGPRAKGACCPRVSIRSDNRLR